MTGTPKKKNIDVKRFFPTHLLLTVNVQHIDTLVFLQNNYKYWYAKVNNKNTPVNTTFYTFISVPVTNGVNTVEFVYHDAYLIPFILFSISGFIICIIIYVRKSKNSIYKQSVQNQ
ncbi:MAG: YfhO family protein [Ilyomonas sp.]